MILYQFSFSSIVFLVLFAVAPFANAANDHQFSTNVSVGGITVTIDGAADQLVVNANNFVVTLSPGGSMTVTAAGKNILKNSLDKPTICNANSSSATLDWGAAQAGSVEVTVTPQTGTCVDGGGVLSSGGGGGSSLSTAASAPVAAVQTSSTAMPQELTTAVSPIFTADLSFGQTNDDVKRLQELLARDSSLYPEGITSGYFGLLTREAVKRFQKKYGIDQVGRVGPQTRAKLNEILSAGASPASVVAQPSEVAGAVSPIFTADLSFGQTNDDVKRLQELLARDSSLYPEGITSGYFGSLTVKAVKAFQAKYGISAIGRVGPQTRAKLREVFGSGTIPAVSAAASSSPSAEDQLKALQEKLKALQDQLKALTPSSPASSY